MNRKSTTRSKILPAGMTLVEVVAGLALLASVLAATLAVRVRATRQLRQSEERRQAIAAADAILSVWQQNPSQFQRAAVGRVNSRPDFYWRTFRVPNVEAIRLNAEVVRLEVGAVQSNPDDAPLAIVDVLVPRSVTP